jgi:protein arginine kinase
MNSKELDQPILEHLDQVPPVEKEYISEHFLIPYSFRMAGVGVGCVYDKTGRFIALFNLENHLHLQMTVVDDKIEEASRQLFKLEESVQKSCAFSFSDRFGYVTSDPKSSGTGFRAHHFLQLPALIHTENLLPFLEKEKSEQVDVLGLLGNQEDWLGDLVCISNSFTTGVTEESIVSGTKEFAKRLLLEEERVRKEMADSDAPAIKDMVSRSFALLSHSYQLEAKEAMNGVSLLKLGLYFGWVKDVDITTLNTLFFLARRAHLMTQFNEELSTEDLLHKRAQFLHDKLKSMQLTL